MIPGHTCNAYCAGGEHTELIYANAHLDLAGGAAMVARAYRAEGLSVRVHSVEPASEAPPIEAQPADRLHRLVGNTDSGQRPYLVRWS